MQWAAAAVPLLGAMVTAVYYLSEVSNKESQLFLNRTNVLIEVAKQTKKIEVKERTLLSLLAEVSGSTPSLLVSLTEENDAANSQFILELALRRSRQDYGPTCTLPDDVDEQPPVVKTAETLLGGLPRDRVVQTLQVWRFLVRSGCIRHQSSFAFLRVFGPLWNSIDIARCALSRVPRSVQISTGNDCQQINGNLETPSDPQLATPHAGSEAGGETDDGKSTDKSQLGRVAQARVLNQIAGSYLDDVFFERSLPTPHRRWAINVEWRQRPLDDWLNLIEKTYDLLEFEAFRGERAGTIAELARHLRSMAGIPDFDYNRVDAFDAQRADAYLEREFDRRHATRQVERILQRLRTLRAYYLHRDNLLSTHHQEMIAEFMVMALGVCALDTDRLNEAYLGLIDYLPEDRRKAYRNVHTNECGF